MNHTTMGHAIIRSQSLLFALKRFSSISNGVNISFFQKHLEVMAYSDLEHVYVRTTIPYIFSQGSIGTGKALRICIYPGYLTHQLNDKGVLALSVEEVDGKCNILIQHEQCVITQLGLYADFDDNQYSKILPSDLVFTINFHKLVNFSHRLNDTVTLCCKKFDSQHLIVSTDERSIVIPFTLRFNMNPFECKIKSKDIAMIKTLFDCHNCFMCIKTDCIIFFNDHIFAVVSRAETIQNTY